MRERDRSVIAWIAARGEWRGRRASLKRGEENEDQAAR